MKITCACGQSFTATDASGTPREQCPTCGTPFLPDAVEDEQGPQPADGEPNFEALPEPADESAPLEHIIDPYAKAHRDRVARSGDSRLWGIGSTLGVLAAISAAAGYLYLGLVGYGLAGVLFFAGVVCCGAAGAGRRRKQ